MSRRPGSAARPRLFMVLTGLLVGLPATPPIAMAGGNNADWPTYRHDVARRGFVDAHVELPLSRMWTHAASVPPRPAWPPPARGSYWQQLEHLESRTDDDRTFHPIAVGDDVYFSSSSDDRVVCLDARTGTRRWSFVTDGPVRYAPMASGGNLYVGSDDGHVYCLRATDGSQIWKSQLGPADWRIPGNGRLISSWPVRTGVLVEGGVLYALAGLFPDQGVYAVAMRPKDGKIVWRRQLDNSPQGYLLATRDSLHAPTGRGTPIGLRRSDGEVVKTFGGSGGTYAIATQTELVSGRGSDGQLTVSDRLSRQQLISFRGQHLAVTPTTLYLLGDRQLTALDRARLMQTSRQLTAVENERAEVQERAKKRNLAPEENHEFNRRLADLDGQTRQLQRQRRACQRWKVFVAGGDSLIVCRNVVVIGGDDTIVAHNCSDGKEVWRGNAKGRVLGLALAGRRLLASTDLGHIVCYGPNGKTRPTPPAEPVTPKPPPTPNAARLVDAARRLVDQCQVRRGYCLVLGVGSGRLACEIARRSQLTVVAVDHDWSRVAAAREAVDDAGLYGHRVSIHHVATDRLPFTDYFANLVTSESAMLDNGPRVWPESEIQRVLRPYGGTAWFDVAEPPLRRGPLPGAGQWTHQYANTANTASTDDRLVRRDLQLQWFGGPGPRRLVDRHLRAPAPLLASGRLFVPADNGLIAVDAYNGTELWHLELPGSQRYGMPYDTGYMSTDGEKICIAVQDRCLVVDATTGRPDKQIPLPLSIDGPPVHWGYTALDDGRLYGSFQKTGASRTRPSRALIEADYANQQPLVTSRGIFCVDPSTNSEHWRYGRGAIVNSTITIAAGHLFFVESQNHRSVVHATGRVTLERLLASEANLVCLNAATGEVFWQRPLPEHVRPSRNILYLQYAQGLLIITGSHVNRENDSWYKISTLDAATGGSVWEAGHAAGKPGAFSHGEQVHHPVVLGDLLVAEPVLYELTTGRQLDPQREPKPWRLQRPGHSCGTMSGAGSCLFFRADVPTLMDLTADLPRDLRIRSLPPTRPGCWINIVPAGGLVLIPEASASCVCNYPLQTSSAYRPRPPRENGAP